MIIDTHFHAFPGKYLELIPESQNDVRGVGFHAFDHRQYIDVMDKYGVDVGVLSNTGGRIEKDGIRQAALSSSRQRSMPGQLEQIFTASKNSLADRQHSGNFPNRLQWNLRPLPESQAHRGPPRRDDPALSRPAQLARRKSRMQTRAGRIFQEDLLRHCWPDTSRIYQARL